MKIQTLTIVGVGLIGGSIAFAARRRGLAIRILGTGRSQINLDRARELGAIDEGFLDHISAVCQSDVSVFCTPVDQIAAQVLAAAPGCSPGTLLTDAGSTKAAILRDIESHLPSAVSFVGSHPLAGSEKRGLDFADADLFEGRLTIVTKTPRTDSRALERTVAFWQALGSRVRIMDPDEHDRALALTSHLPHLVAAALAGVLPAYLHELTATGFRDTTRVAAGDPSIWRGIFVQNRAAVLDALSRFTDALRRFHQALVSGDAAALDGLLAHAKEVRDALGS
jgi:prephenate dehydrogenase